MLIVGRLFLGVGIGLANQVSNIYYTYQDSDKQHTYFCLHVSRLTAGKCSQSLFSDCCQAAEVTHLPLNSCNIEHLLQCCRWHPCTSLRRPTLPAVAD